MRAQIRAASSRARRRRQQGAVAIAFILLAALLIGFVGFGLDVGRLYVSKTELQNAADACALSAAGALTGANADQLVAAEDFGTAAAQRNLIGMQARAVSVTADQDITFSATLDGSYQSRTAATDAGAALNMRYVRCTLAEANIPMLLLQVVNLIDGQAATPGTAKAEAVATLAPSVSNCALPLAICKKAGSSEPDFGYVRGEWLLGRFDPPANLTGKFKWVKFPGFERTPDLAGLIGGSGQCDLSDTIELEPSTGAINSLVDVWNWRMGVMKTSGPPAGAFVPDYSGYAYTPVNWPVQFNAFDDFKTQRANNTPWNGLPALGGGWQATTSEVHAAGADRRLVVGPVVDCSGWDSGGTESQPILGWACYLMLNPVANPNMDMGLEYRGPANDISSGCVTSGAPGGPGAGGPKVPTLVQ
ncbi:MAG: pilus assembly protein TadG [Zoogloeaceae bacterium]|nr:hypothetical protein [Rhodocyclaceae bacterium]MCP5234914.1 pilus assembly protein TadG [Zoogloeaceae bacterium]